jgi:hypothetical protein
MSVPVRERSKPAGIERRRRHEFATYQHGEEHRALAAATLRYAATLLSEKEQPGSFWLNELAESFEWGYQDRVLAQVVDG